MSDLKFFHIPKTGGTSIEETAKKHGILWGRYERQNKYTVPKVNKWHTPQRIEGTVFCVIRNPFDRILSNFRHVFKIKDYNVTNLNNWIPQIIDQAKIDPYIRDAHFLPQSEFAKFCDIFLLFDDLQNELNWVCDKFGVPKMDLEYHYGGVEQNEKRKDAQYYQFSVSDITEENKNIIQNFYFDDVILYTKTHKDWTERKI